MNSFKTAFSLGTENVCLVIKVMNGKEEDDGWLKLKDMASKDDRIILINKMLTKEDLLSLKQECDCYVSLHRAEGLGRGPMEAMMLGKPTILTNYSGSTDYSNHDNSCLVDYSLVPIQEGQYPQFENQVWAGPDVEHAAYHMKKLYNNSELSSRLGQLGREYIQEHYSPKKCGENYNKRLTELGLLD